MLQPTFSLGLHQLLFELDFIALVALCRTAHRHVYASFSDDVKLRCTRLAFLPRLIEQTIHRIHLYNTETKISPVRDWRSTPTYCQLQSRMTQKLGQKSKIRPR